MRWIAFGVVIGVMLTSCRMTPEGPRSPSRLINCGAEVVQKHWADIYPKVTTCMVALIESPMGCLDAIPTVAAVSMEAVACVVYAEGKQAATQSGYNPEDTVSLRKSERAKAWIESHRFEFEP